MINTDLISLILSRPIQIHVRKNTPTFDKHKSEILTGRLNDVLINEYVPGAGEVSTTIHAHVGSIPFKKRGQDVVEDIPLRDITSIEIVINP